MELNNQSFRYEGCNANLLRVSMQGTAAVEAIKRLEFNLLGQRNWGQIVFIDIDSPLLAVHAAVRFWNNTPHDHQMAVVVYDFEANAFVVCFSSIADLPSGTIIERSRIKQAIEGGAAPCSVPQ